ncbi:hypothetical protein Gasu2_42160 [Galdieria sulphuraria]|uniref:Hydrolase, alpha/beta fold family protein n=1 Tax=Galdieria sulphuraria TaxID=130081 RepID=M2XSS3_GALSU|nr:hydrolase, alpha/beta fold family protein [Galdieria sulphuraria]EME26464.1 hydrolase, alpha/beta fold family protein [Galdieria sulphuraria]GJD09996.1 hypothetical protein Gasu2_42160 [Galdieria sulphuraria]|eukprot:XP_005702984.1 hydrolase, alpha/beta fold family protein [Galdieria sulphuraria]
MQLSRVQYESGSYLQSDGTETEYRRYGKGGELVVLVPGFSCGMDMWNCLIQNIANSEMFSFLCLENRGFGSGRCSSYRLWSNQGGYSTDTMANDVWHIVNNFSRGQVHLIGFSLGGMIVSKAASVYPERVLSLTLLSTPKCGIHILLPGWRTLKVVMRVISHYVFLRVCPLCRHRSCNERNNHVRIFFEIYFKYSEYYLLELTKDNSALIPRWRFIKQQQEREKYSLPRYMSIWGQLHAILFHRLCREEMTKIRRASFPILCISGKYDQLVSVNGCRNFARELNGNYIMLSGAHFITEECMEQVHQLIRLFLKKQLDCFNDISPLWVV